MAADGYPELPSIEQVAETLRAWSNSRKFRRQQPDLWQIVRDAYDTLLLLNAENQANKNRAMDYELAWMIHTSRS